MAIRTLQFSGNHVGLVVRGKTSADHKPGVMEQHADCILSNGAPMGFFGEGGGNLSSGSTSSSRGGRSSGSRPSSADSSSSSSGGSVGMGLDGAVYDFQEMLQKRPYYVNDQQAQTYKVISAVMRIPVSAAAAKIFDSYWTNLDKNPDTFYILGGNCSTRASGAFMAANLLAGGIPGLDTPSNLWDQLLRVFGKQADCCYGRVSFQPNAGGQSYNVKVAE